MTPPISQFEILCGMIVLMWVAFGALGVIGWRQERRQPIKIHRIGSRVLTLTCVVLLTMFFTGVLGSVAVMISNEYPPIVKVIPSAPDGWWKSYNRR
jgi:Mg2+/citrate symporter